MYLKYFGIRVTDLERSVRFYTALLGLNEVKRGDVSKFGGGRGKWVLLKDSESGAELYEGNIDSKIFNMRRTK